MRPRPGTRALRAALLLAPLLAAGACRRAAGPPAVRHLVLVSLDTTRADHLGCYGDARARTPRIDALAAEGTRFDEAITAAPTTLASHASILTGTPPHTHGVPRNGFVLDGSNVTLAEVLRGAGFTTLAAVGAFPLAREFGLDQGFEGYDDDLGHAPDGQGYAERDAAHVTDAALALVDHADLKGDDARLFLFVHYFDAHAPYAPPPPFDTAFPRDPIPVPRTLEDGVLHAADDHYEALTGKRPGRSVVVHGLPAALVDAADGKQLGDDAALDALYRGELEYVDQELGRLLDGLAQRGLLDDAAVVVTADHGETMWEHSDFWNHGLALHETTVHVPLIVRLPPAARPEAEPAAVAEPVSSIDLAPTALALLGLAPAPTMEGVDLGPLLAGRALARGPVETEATMPFDVEASAADWANAKKPRAVRDGRWKYVRWPYNGHEELFDLEADPGERANLLGAGAAPPPAEVLTRLRGLLGTWSETARPRPTTYRAGRDHEATRRLDALGYGGGEGH